MPCHACLKHLPVLPMRYAPTICLMARTLCVLCLALAYTLYVTFHALPLILAPYALRLLPVTLTSPRVTVRVRVRIRLLLATHTSPTPTPCPLYALKPVIPYPHPLSSPLTLTPRPSPHPNARCFPPPSSLCVGCPSLGMQSRACWNSC